MAIINYTTKEKELLARIMRAEALESVFLELEENYG